MLSLTVPDLVTSQESISVLPGENVTIDCVPSDSSLALEWEVITKIGFESITPITDDVGSAEIEGSIDEEIPVEVSPSDGNSLRERLQYQLPLIYQLTLINTTMTDTGFFICFIKSPPNDDTRISRQIVLTVLSSKFSLLFA